MAQGTEKYLEFQLGEKSFALPIAHIREIMEYPAVESVSGAPSQVLGVMNLRGNLVVVFDIAHCLEQRSEPIGNKTCVIITENHGHGAIGYKVDVVKQVFDINLDHLESVPQLKGRLESPMINAVAKLQNRMLTILDSDKLLSDEMWRWMNNKSLVSE
ncbi:chemotaxis protein CheW [Vibrio sp. TRT 21S02]|uniref:chemotaxis protein CheW n=1 Tax=Vibrio sp. TRT 21S02 TaxID=3418507 RepID=UPI003CF5F940